jgi:hypothetical protein
LQASYTVNATLQELLSSVQFQVSKINMTDTPLFRLDNSSVQPPWGAAIGLCIPAL